MPSTCLSAGERQARLLTQLAVDGAGDGDPSAGAAPLLLRRRVQRRFDSGGRCRERLTFLYHITPDQYDADCAAADAAGLPPSLRRALGDCHSGAQLLADTAADRRATVARLRGSRLGREALGQLAGEVLRRFGPRIRAARAIVGSSPAMEAWARAELVERRWPGAVEGKVDRNSDSDVPVGPDGIRCTRRG